MNAASKLLREADAHSVTVGHEPASIRSILFLVHDDGKLEERLQSALSLARTCSAHLNLLQVIPVAAYAATDVYGGAYISAEIGEALQQQADLVRLRIEQHLKKEDVSWTFKSVTSAIVPEVLANAGFADLIVMGRLPNFREFSRSGPSLLGELVCEARTPIFVPGDETSSFDPLGTVLIAWNGSVEAANAVRSAIGLLKLAADVRVVRFAESKEMVLSDAELLAYLSRHDLHVELETRLPGTDAQTALLDYAAAAGAQYAVIGGYSHSRAGEFLFGGVTRDLLRACPLSLIMAH